MQNNVASRAGIRLETSVAVDVTAATVEATTSVTTVVAAVEAQAVADTTIGSREDSTGISTAATSPTGMARPVAVVPCRVAATMIVTAVGAVMVASQRVEVEPGEATRAAKRPAGGN